MSTQVDAVYEDGVLKPLEPLDLAESERVVLTITRDEKIPDHYLAVDFVESIRKRWEGVPPSIGREELLRQLAGAPGKLSDTVIEERGEY